jgi:hypothetical protein
MMIKYRLAYSMKIDLLSNATVVERAVHFVEKHV